MFYNAVKTLKKVKTYTLSIQERKIKDFLNAYIETLKSKRNILRDIRNKKRSMWTLFVNELTTNLR